MLETAGSYGLPVYVTENGIADADDDLRAAYLRGHLRALRDAMRDRAGARARLFPVVARRQLRVGYGYFPKFGLYSFDPVTLGERSGPARACSRASRAPARCRRRARDPLVELAGGSTPPPEKRRSATARSRA